jgi:hypothetical protein
VSLPGARCRWGLALLLSAGVFSCLNPRPDDQPLAQGIDTPIDNDNSPPAVTVDPAGGLGAGAANGGSDPGDTVESDTPGPRAPAADAGPAPDAGPEDERDAGAPAE